MNYRVLMPVQNSGNAASFTFNAHFTKNVPQEYVEKPLEENQSYLLFIKMIQSVKETLHHHKDLESNNI